MNKEEILARSRNENKGMDIMELQSLEKASRIAAQVGMLLCCFVAVMEVAVTGQVSMESWLIYFGILSTLFLIKYRLMKELILRNRLKQARTAMHLSQTQLAELVGVSRNTISSIETGQFNPTAKLALILCIALEQKFEDLFYFDEA